MRYPRYRNTGTSCPGQFGRHQTYYTTAGNHDILAGLDVAFVIEGIYHNRQRFYQGTLFRTQAVYQFYGAVCLQYHMLTESAIPMETYDLFVPTQVPHGNATLCAILFPAAQHGYGGDNVTDLQVTVFTWTKFQDFCAELMADNPRAFYPVKI
jgi:hypothetical protein